MEHDFKRFPELKNSQMADLYFESPHKQITENFMAKIIDVHDGDTVRVTMEERDFSFPIRLLDIAAPELNEEGGKESQEWLEGKVKGKKVEIEIDPKNRVGKYGRLLGRIILGGMDIGEESIMMGKSVAFANRKSGTIPDFTKEMEGAF